MPVPAPEPAVPPPANATPAAAARAYLEPRVAEMVALLGELVLLESPSDDAEALQRQANALLRVFGPMGEVEQLPGALPGTSHLLVHVPGRDGSSAPHALVLCHYDTVWPLGTIQRSAFRIDPDGMARGPGCFDMKGGIVLLAFALRALSALGRPPSRPLRLLFTCDEEIGSPSSRAAIERQAAGAACALVLESPLPGGVLKTARKGTGDYHLRVEGRAAHAGVEPEKGVNAIVELARQVLALEGLADPSRGTTVSVGVVHGGTRPNVVPALAEADIDVRVSEMREAERVDRALRGLTPTLPGARLAVSGGLNRPPMERTDATAALFERARALAADAGLSDLREGSTGGGSDGNFTAALGVPTLDGLGPEGDGAHAEHEQVRIASLPGRAALVAGLLATL